MKGICTVIKLVVRVSAHAHIWQALELKKTLQLNIKRIFLQNIFHPEKMGEIFRPRKYEEFEVGGNLVRVRPKKWNDHSGRDLK